MPKFCTATLCAWMFLLAIPLPPPQDVMNTDLKPQTVQAFDRCAQATEARVAKEVTRPGAFLYVEGLPEPQRTQTLANLRNGDVYMESLPALDASGAPIEVPNGLIHHWIGAVFIPGANLQEVLSLVEDYDHHQDVYKPEVVRSRIIHHDGNNYQVYLRLVKRKVITVTLDTDHDVQYFPIDARHCRSRSVSTRIAEVVNAGLPNEHEKPVGHDGGFLWRMNSYWRFEEKDGGVYVEVESLSLTRDIPVGLGWLIKPFVTSIPRESLMMTLGSTRTAVLAAMQKGGVRNLKPD